MNEERDSYKKQLKEALEERPLDELSNLMLCYRCVVSGMKISDSLYDPDHMFASPQTGDYVCLHCLDTERDSGHENLRKEERALVSEVEREFKRLIEEASRP